MQTLIITEKPSVAQTIAAVVGAITRKDGYIEGNGYIVGWCLGHLAQLVGAEAYDPQLNRWRVADLPILPQDWRYRVPQDKRKQFGILRGLMLRDDVSQVINACDAGREGELIFRNLNYLTGCTKPTLRLWLNSMEESEIRRALSDLRPGTDYDRLFAAARCRERADWLVGINATRLLSVTYHRTLNTGRVVSPTLALLTQREADIAGFVPESFYTAELHLGSFTAESKRFSNRAEAEAAVVSAGGKCIVTSDPRPAAGGDGLRELRGVERHHAPLCPARREGHRARGQLRRRAEAPLRLRHRRHRHPAQLAPVLAVGGKRREPRRSPARLAAGVQCRGRVALQPAAR